MRRVFLFLIVGVVVMVAAWELANLPGRVSASIGSITIETSIGFAILTLVLLFVAIFLGLRIFGVLVGLPAAGLGWQRRRRLELGERAVTRVLVALAAGEQRDARRDARKARQLLGASPQTLLLVAEAGRLSGREDEAEEAFNALTKYEDAKFLGFRGLLRQAIDRREWDKAEAIAREAELAHPGTAWLRQQRAELALHTDNWAEAAELVAWMGPAPRITLPRRKPRLTQPGHCGWRSKPARRIRPSPLRCFPTHAGYAPPGTKIAPRRRSPRPGNVRRIRSLPISRWPPARIPWRGVSWRSAWWPRIRPTPRAGSFWAKLRWRRA